MSMEKMEMFNFNVDNNTESEKNLTFDYDEKTFNRHFQKTEQMLARPNLNWDKVSFELSHLKTILEPEKFSQLHVDDNLFDTFSKNLEIRKSAGTDPFLYALSQLKQVFPEKFMSSEMINKSFNSEDWEDLKENFENSKKNKNWKSLLPTLSDLKIISEEKFSEFSSSISNENWNAIIGEIQKLKQEAEEYDNYKTERISLAEQGYPIDLQKKLKPGLMNELASYCANLKIAFPEKFNPSEHIDSTTWNKMVNEYKQTYQDEESNFPNLAGWASLSFAKDLKEITK